MTSDERLRGRAEGLRMAATLIGTGVLLYQACAQLEGLALDELREADETEQARGELALDEVSRDAG